MNINFREVERKDKEFILNANNEINILSGLNDSKFENNIDNDLYKDKICKVIILPKKIIILLALFYIHIFIGKLWKRDLFITSLY